MNLTTEPVDKKVLCGQVTYIPEMLKKIHGVFAHIVSVELYLAL